MNLNSPFCLREGPRRFLRIATCMLNSITFPLKRLGIVDLAKDSFNLSKFRATTREASTWPNSFRQLGVVLDLRFFGPVRSPLGVLRVQRNFDRSVLIHCFKFLFSQDLNKIVLHIFFQLCWASNLVIQILNCAMQVYEIGTIFNEYRLQFS